MKLVLLKGEGHETLRFLRFREMEFRRLRLPQENISYNPVGLEGFNPKSPEERRLRSSYLFCPQDLEPIALTNTFVRLYYLHL